MRIIRTNDKAQCEALVKDGFEPINCWFGYYNEDIVTGRYMLDRRYTLFGDRMLTPVAVNLAESGVRIDSFVVNKYLGLDKAYSIAMLTGQIEPDIKTAYLLEELYGKPQVDTQERHLPIVLYELNTLDTRLGPDTSQFFIDEAVRILSGQYSEEESAKGLREIETIQSSKRFREMMNGRPLF